MTDIVTPIVNLNGTSRPALIGQCLAAVRGLQVAFHAICDAAPHGRDYPGDAERFRRATELHNARLKAIEAMIAEYTAIGTAIRPV